MVRVGHQRAVVKTWLHTSAIGSPKRTLAFGETTTFAWWSRFNFAGALASHSIYKETI